MKMKQKFHNGANTTINGGEGNDYIEASAHSTGEFEGAADIEQYLQARDYYLNHIERLMHAAAMTGNPELLEQACTIADVILADIDYFDEKWGLSI